MRSMSGTCASSRRQAVAGIALAAARRSPRGVRARRAGRAAAWCSQWRSRREPIAVRQPSSSENSVGDSVAADGFGQFQVAPRGGVQADEFVFRFDRQALHVLQAAALGRLGIAQQRAGRAEGRAQAVGAEAGQGRHAELRRAAPCGRAATSKCHSGTRWVWPMRPSANMASPLRRRAAFRPARCVPVPAPGAARRSSHPAENSISFSAPLASDSQARPVGHGLALRDRAQRQQRPLGLFRQQVGIGQRAGRDHAHHLALDRALGQGRVADLLADRARIRPA